MKLKFEANLEYQNQAISSIVDIFKGEKRKGSIFTIPNLATQGELITTSNGISNNLDLDKDEILENVKAIQLRNGLKQTEKLNTLDFDIEMETGTGKTYVYLKSIFELHKNYGFSKFIIVVPSIAIKEGVYKSLEITKEHFDNIYNNERYNYFIYNSKNPEDIRSFATNDHISIMVINIDAFNKDFKDTDFKSKGNIIHRSIDKLNGLKPIELIQETNPFVIIDEPQSVDTTKKSKAAIKSLNPLAIFRFSATHVEKHSLIYKLDAVDAFDLELVKQIEVSSFESKDYHNNAYLLLKSVNNKKSPITTRIEMDVQGKNGIQRKIVTIKKGDDLFEKSGNRDVYDGYLVDEIYCEEGNEFVSFATNSTKLVKNVPVGDVDTIALKEEQIVATIEEHLNKTLILKKQGIKVLSLFFMDKVANYRIYDKDGNPEKGKYALLFEKAFKKVAKREDYKSLFENENIDILAEEIHDGYFAKDKKGKGKMKDTKGNTLDDDYIYSLIMKNKERLLSFDTKLSFIFSHSALREGWDNPNVFQICTLNETKSTVKKRQEIGRGLRLCVNQDGERQRGFSTNILTVMANESYEEFCQNLQKEYEEESGIKFGIIEKHIFANIIIEDEKTKENKPLGKEASEKIYNSFVEFEYIEKDGKVQDKFRKAIEANIVELPKEVEKAREQIIGKCRRILKGVPVQKTKDKKIIKLNKKRFLSPAFTELWDSIKYKTTYRVQFETEELIAKCVEDIKNNLVITRSKLIKTKAKVEIGKGGVIAEDQGSYSVSSENYNENLPDIITYLQNKTKLTRKTIVEILVQSETLNQFKVNPQKYMDEICKYIKSVMRIFIVDGIKYTKIGDDSYYAQELFETKEIIGYLEKNALESNKNIYDYVIYDSEGVEKTFAEKLDANDNVIVYAKLPDWFKINTPLGSYNPDWAVVVKDDNGDKKLFFVLETKGNIMSEDLRPKEKAKIECGHKHFEALGNKAEFKEVDSFEKFMDIYSENI